jgi:hypothetical protein
MNESNQQSSVTEGAAAGGSNEGVRDRRPTSWHDSDEAFGLRQADGLGLSGLFIEGDDGRFVSALEYVINRRAAEADEKE